jgi:Na+-driven multidrug efflux pump
VLISKPASPESTLQATSRAPEEDAVLEPLGEEAEAGAIPGHNFGIGSFSDDPAVLAIGTTYLRTVGPFFGFFGIGYALYCAGQGTGRMGWPVAGAVTRAAIAVVGGAAAIRLGASLDHIFMAVSLGMMSFGLFSLPGLFLRSAYGTRQRSSAACGPTALCTR